MPKASQHATNNAKDYVGNFLTLKQLNHHYKKLLLGFKIWEGELVVERIL
jgi:hypothetical protein